MRPLDIWNEGDLTFMGRRPKPKDDDPIGVDEAPGFGLLGAILFTLAPVAIGLLIMAVYYLL